MEQEITRALVLNEDLANSFEEGKIGMTELNDESASRVESSIAFEGNNVDQDVRSTSYGKGKWVTQRPARFDDRVMGLSPSILVLIMDSWKLYKPQFDYA